MIGKRVPWSNNQGRSFGYFDRVLYPVMKNWNFNRYPDLSKIFYKEQINDLLSDAISRDDFNIDRSKCLIDFSINCGYEYETGKHETAALHLLANIKPNNWVTLVKDLFKIYTNFDKEKLKVLNLLRSGERVANIVKRFNVNESTIRAVR
uniref:Uncharacterized protein n=1 Tax=Trichogramma kaykai TaxID=54128 RepID=A0ABD2XIZ3_9HYME